MRHREQFGLSVPVLTCILLCIFTMQAAHADQKAALRTPGRHMAMPVYRPGSHPPAGQIAPPTPAALPGLGQEAPTLADDGDKTLAVNCPAKLDSIPAESPYAERTGIFDSIDGAIQDTGLFLKDGEYELAIVPDEHIGQASWIKADFTAAGQSFTIPSQAAGTALFDADWSGFIDNPGDYALRFISLGAGNTFDIVIVDGSGKELRFPIAGDGGILGANTGKNQTAIAGFDWLASKAPGGFDWSDIRGVKIEATQPGWLLIGDLQVVAFNEDYDVAMGVAGHDLQGPGWRRRLDNYVSYAGQKPSVGTYFTTIFEPIREKCDGDDHYSDIVERAEALERLDVVPAVTLEFRSWAQITGDQEKIAAERTRFDSLNAGGISYDDFINDYVNLNRVLDAVNEGKLDPILQAVARQMKQLGPEPVYLRLFHEPYWWFPWGIREQSDIQKFKDAWVRVGQIFENAGADNVKFVMTLDPAEPGGSSWSEVAAIPAKYLSVVELDGYTDPNLRQNQNLSANELFTKKLTEIDWQLKLTYPDPADRPTIALGEFAFSGGDYFTKEQAYSWFAGDLMHRAFPVNRFSVLYTYQAGPRPAVDALNYSPPQEGYWSATWQPEAPWYPDLMKDLKSGVGLWQPDKKPPTVLHRWQTFIHRWLEQFLRLTRSHNPWFNFR
ncbi:MAG: glycosyl hydrolase [Candidatus Omnitrophica bacterium]|nr:glycosyl hydrolase [Candidatus Omnitrophota bacterium]